MSENKLDNKQIKKITINGGDVFEGTPEQFADSFFSNVSEQTVTDWAAGRGFTVKIEFADLKDTLNLPKTDFPMMPPDPKERLAREQAVIARWKADNLYGKLRSLRRHERRFVLHDGPPYANGDIHLGHALNKVLKDIVVRSKTMLGYDAPFVPGWDCHGLPIEQAAIQSGPNVKHLPVADFRKICADHAAKWVDRQSAGFDALAVSASPIPYLTMEPRYEGAVLDVLRDLVAEGLVYRRKKPVHWCCNHRTALADAELEYVERRDASAYVLLRVVQDERGLPWKIFAGAKTVFLMVWTTTPWTLPANRAVAVSPAVRYVAVKPPYTGFGPGTVFVLAEDAVGQLESLPPGQSYWLSEPFYGYELIGSVYEHPFDKLPRPIVSAEFVTAETGTGLVHIAPGHGPQDYELGIRHGLEVYCPVDEYGNYEPGTGFTSNVLADANAVVLNVLQEMVYKTQDIVHSYPHCWRCHQPVIFRATEQWFVSVGNGTDANRLAQKMAYEANWLPDWGQVRFVGMLQSRPDWCISRQRKWGIPIPYFTDGDRVVFNVEIISRVADFIRKNGADAWYTSTPRQILGPGIIEAEKLKKGTDVLDVWFESGASFYALMDRLAYPADLYLEGTDQHRGWFQASLLAAIPRRRPPFKTALTHGFLVDKDGRKMSKHLGNDIKVTEVLEKYGVDVLRLWVASADYTNDVTCDHKVFKNCEEMSRKIRNTLRYLLSNLYDFEGVFISPGNIDHYMIWRAMSVQHQVYAAYERYDFKTAVKLIYDFANLEVSALYAKAVKDRLYCELPRAVERLSAQTGCYCVLRSLLEMLAPVCPVMADEAWQHLKRVPSGKDLQESIHLEACLPTDPVLAYDGPWTEIAKVIPGGVYKLDEMKKSLGLNNPLDAEVVITVPSLDDWQRYGTEIEDALGVGCHSFKVGDTLSVDFIDRRETYAKCERSRKRRPDVGKDPEFPTLSLRDAEVVRKLAMGYGT
jgi:isoleucyl-tRNA synthetase